MNKEHVSIQEKGVRTFWMTAFATIIGLGLSVGIASAQGNCDTGDEADDANFTSEFRLQDCRFTTRSQNPYFPLRPGHQVVLETEDGDERVVITVLKDKEVINLNGRRIRTRVVEERESEEGKVFEISRNFFAVCLKTNDVFYFGEDVFVCDLDETGGFDADGRKCLGLDGSGESDPENPGQWRAGVNGAIPGVLMPGGFLLGSKYFQEVAVADGALDRGENVGMGLEFNENDFHFEGCVKVVDTNSAEGGDSCLKDEGDVKIYCPRVGLVQDEDLKLVEINRNNHDDDDDDDD